MKLILQSVTYIGIAFYMHLSQGMHTLQPLGKIKRARDFISAKNGNKRKERETAEIGE